METVITYKERSSWQVTKSVWSALFMREIIKRTRTNRYAWFWMLAEPVLFVFFMVVARAFLGRIKDIAGADYIPWILVGLMVFQLFSKIVKKSLKVIKSNGTLFIYRQIHPCDTVFTSIAVEGFLQTVIFILIIFGASLLEYNLIADDPLFAVLIWFSMWSLAIGMTLITTVAVVLIPELNLLVRMIMLPLLFVSGVIFPVNFLPAEIQIYLLYNPLLHCTELLRAAFFPEYKVLDGVSLLYVYSCILPMVAMGLLLHIRFYFRIQRS